MNMNKYYYVDEQRKLSDRFSWNRPFQDRRLVRLYMEDEVGRMFLLMGWILFVRDDLDIDDIYDDHMDASKEIQTYMEENVDKDFSSNPFPYVFRGLSKWIQRDFDSNEDPGSAFGFLSSAPEADVVDYDLPVYGVDWVVMFLLQLRLHSKYNNRTMTEGLSESQLMYWVDQLNRYLRVNYDSRSIVLPSCHSWGRESTPYGQTSWARAVKGHTKSVLTQDPLWARIDWNNSFVVYMMERIGSLPGEEGRKVVDNYMRRTIKALQDEKLFDDKPLSLLPEYYKGRRDAMDAFREEVEASDEAEMDPDEDSFRYAYDLTVKALPAVKPTLEPYEVRLRKQASYRAQLLAGTQPRAGAGGPDDVREIEEGLSRLRINPSPPQMVPIPDPIPTVPDVNDKRTLRRAVREARGFRGPGGKHRTQDQCYGTVATKNFL